MDLQSDDTANIKRRFGLKRWFRYQRLKYKRRSKNTAFRLYLHWIILACIIVPMLGLDGCSKSSKVKTAAKVAGVPVLVKEAQLSDVPVYIMALGTVTPLYSVTVKTQVNGQLLRFLFKEGQTVEADTLIAQIDPRPYEAQLLQYKGALLRDQALLDNARIDLERYKGLYTQDAVSQQTLATQESLVRQYEGDVTTDQGQIAATRLNLIYCNITSPITGKIGLQQVDPGNYVQTTDANGLVVINTFKPIYVEFSIPEDDLPRVTKKIAQGEVLQVKALDREQKELIALGTVASLDNQINTTTGTLNIKAEFANEDERLYPNQFVNVQLLVDTLKSATVVQTSAVQHGTKGDYVYVLQPNQTVKMVAVNTLVTIDEHTAISGDVKSGDKVVVEGTDKLKDGSAVTVLKNQTDENSKA